MPATVLGKRKSRTATKEESPSISQEEALAIFQRHFEAQFKPLPPSHTPASAAKPERDLEESLSDDDSDEDGASEDSWSGVSGAEDSDSDSEEVEIEVVSHAKNTPSASADVPGLSKRELKALLSSRVPAVTTTTTTTTTTTSSKRKPAVDGEGEGEDAPSLLKNDLALQRLLTESHLFSKSSSSAATSSNNAATEHAGRNRHLANDLRLAALGSKRSVYAQARMPMGIRKGIAGAAAAREEKRRREARENGVVLERKSGGGGVVPAAGDWLRGFGAKGKGRGGGGRGERRKKGGGGDRIAVDAPAVGRLRNGMLKLSRRDISEIQGSGGGSGMTKGKKRRR
ncbi:hypothetical protein DL766_000249 [Monosporascus sp. MC13-8B]|uniref:Protein FAF1 n=1 Tax=Monosporascus cannonballus TaxID=155416 RepID=A0ABY0H8Y9_9PEZI|nr:hypothetical protein DL762_005498 [Monosporascus cannonballus]RYP39807.1 hypothetical protein DL766_000249 [Monosporascus sp. MC13-8B]